MTNRRLLAAVSCAYSDMMKRFVLYMSCVLLTVCNTFAQDTAWVLPAPVIFDSIERAHRAFESPIHTDHADLYIAQQQLMDRALLFASNAQVRSFGPGKVATLSRHGLPAEHSKVNFNGLELNSPLNGVVDFSTLPLFLIGKDASALFERWDLSSNIKSTTPRSNTTKATMQYGSFDYFSGGIKQSIVKDDFSMYSGIQHIRSDNNFKYTNDLGQRIQQSNSAFKQTHLISGLNYRLNARRSLNAHVLYSNISTQIPPTIFQQLSRANQSNSSLKTTVSFQNQGERQSIGLDAGFIYETLNYDNPDINILADHIFNRFQFVGFWKHYLSNKFILNFRTKQAVEKGVSTNFNGVHYFYLTTNDIDGNWAVNNRLLLTGSLGMAYGRQTFAPIQYKLAATYQPHAHSRFRARINTLYRLPTYNELYWNPGGNADLKPEDGIAVHADYFLSIKKFQAEIGTSFHQLNNRILWQPNDQFVYSPINVQRNQSFEGFVGGSYSMNVHDVDMTFGVRYTYLKTLLITDDATHKNEVPFIPNHSLSHFWEWNARFGLGMRYQGKYQSAAYTNTTNTAQNEGFYIGDIIVNYSFNIEKTNLGLFCSVNNVFNSSYFLITGYPQPSRSIQIGVLLMHKKNNNDF